MSFRGAPHCCYSSLISNGTAFAPRTLFTIIESKLYSSGQKNMPAIIDVNTNSRQAHISPWSRPHFRSGLRKPDCSRSPGRAIPTITIRATAQNQSPEW